MSNELLFVLAGVLAPFAIQGVKLAHGKLTGGELSASSAMGWTYLVCVILTAGVKVGSGELILPAGSLDAVLPELLAQFGVVIGLATVVYKMLLSGDTNIIGRH